MMRRNLVPLFRDSGLIKFKLYTKCIQPGLYSKKDDCDRFIS